MIKTKVYILCVCMCVCVCERERDWEIYVKLRTFYPLTLFFSEKSGKLSLINFSRLIPRNFGVTREHSVETTVPGDT
jgi:hypothetical protein